MVKSNTGKTVKAGQRPVRAYRMIYGYPDHPELTAALDWLREQPQDAPLMSTLSVDCEETRTIKKLLRLANGYDR